jgi:hypothetical protein
LAAQDPIFDVVISGTGTVGTETWVDLGVIPNGKQLLLGFATYIAQDKTNQFETRSNLAGQSAGTAAATQLHDWASTSAGSGVDRDFYQNGYINTLTVTGTGVERFWLRVTAQSSSVGVFNYIVRYTVQ